MSLSWRERIAAARECGTFSAEDKHLALASSTCAVGERMGGHEGHQVYVNTRLPGEERGLPGWTLGVRHSSGFTAAVCKGNISGAELLLDAIEDRALQLKREAGSAHAPATAESDEAAP